MIVAVCIDERGGMTFDGKRQSRDRVLISDLLDMVNGNILYISRYSEPLFSKHGGLYTVSESMLADAQSGEYCFVELEDIAPFLSKIEKMIIYNWNRHYPAETYFGINPSECGFKLVCTEEFAGSSHEKITKEIYER